VTLDCAPHDSTRGKWLKRQEEEEEEEEDERRHVP